MLKPIRLLPRALRVLALSTGLVLAYPRAGLAQRVATPAPRLLLKGGLRLTHLFYQPAGRGWQLVLPSSLGVEYRLSPACSFYAQAEADVSAGRRARGRRLVALPTTSTSLGVGTRYYVNHAAAVAAPGRSAEHWGNYVALEANAELTRNGRRGRPARGLGPVTPAVFAFCGTQHRGPGQLLLYDLNAGLGLEAPGYATERAGLRPWDVAAQVNLRVYLTNRRRTNKSMPAAE